MSQNWFQWLECREQAKSEKKNQWNKSPSAILLIRKPKQCYIFSPTKTVYKT